MLIPGGMQLVAVRAVGEEEAGGGAARVGGGVSGDAGGEVRAEDLRQGHARVQTPLGVCVCHGVCVCDSVRETETEP
eukprot:1086393-Rhodomonas_salina.1